MQRTSSCVLLMLLTIVAATSCRVTRHIESGQAVVSRVEIQVDGQPTSADQLRMALLQKPYRRTFGFLPVSAWIWHPDTLSAWHRLRQRLGTEPAVYDEASTHRTELALQRVMVQRGYLDARVTHTTEISHKKAHIIYNISSGTPRRLASVQYTASDTALNRIVEEDASTRMLVPGQSLDWNILEGERQRLTSLMRERGYWDFDKEHIAYLADTLAGSDQVDLTCVLSGEHQPWYIRKVHFVTNFNMMTSGNDSLLMIGQTRPMELPGYDLTWTGERCYLRDRVLVRSSFVFPGMLYSERAIRNTYSAMSRLHILRYVNIRVEPVAGEKGKLDCYIYLTPQSNHSIQFEVDGTNTAGDLGFALGLSYQHRNAFRGSEAFVTHLKGAYESLSGNVENLVNNNYQEYTAEVGLDFPRFLFPFISDDVRRRSRASTLVKASFSRQSRPEYNRIVAQGSYGYKWNSPKGSSSHQWNILNLSYVYLPEQSETFQQLIQNLGPIIYSSYTSHFILGMDYTFHMGNTLLTTGRQPNTRRDLWSLRCSPEIAGNLLAAVSSIGGANKDVDRYEILGQPFEQYARVDVDLSYSHYLTDRSRVAFHAAGGVAIPYGNSDVMPFEKRYYSGGANSVRGWSVRELGPGSHASSHVSYNYFNQCGDVRLDASMELRTRLFWKFESALFLDAGNVWTIKEYDSQKGGQITSEFYKQIAASWGVGLRVVTDFVILRLDWGFKAHDPSSDADRHWPIGEPFSSKNNTLHFAVGYPF